jgi:hypothetical protein
MAKVGVIISLGLIVLGIALVAVGAFLEPFRTGVGATATPGNPLGESLVAIGLTYILGALGYILAWANPAT